MDKIILIDTPREQWKWHAHMVSNDIDFLHEFAAKLGLGKHMYSNKRGKCRPHYDVPKRLFLKALENGAWHITSEEIVEFLMKHYE